MADITLHVNGLKWEGWQKAEVTRSMDAVFAEATLTLTKGWPGKYGSDIPPIKRGQLCSLSLEGETVITGYVNEHDLVTDKDGFELKISPRDKTALLFKSSVVRNPATWTNQTAFQIISDICKPFGIKVIEQAKSTETQKPFKNVKVNSGETARRAIERMCRNRALLFFADRFGNLVLTTSEYAGKAQAELKHGADGNVLSCRNKASLNDRNSQYIVRSQSPGEDWGNADHTKKTGQATDHGVSLYCPKIIIAEEPEATISLQELAVTTASVNAARSIDLEYTVAGWTQGKDLPLWDINTLVHVRDILGDIDETKLIKRCFYSVSEKSAPETTLTLVNPKAYTLLAEPEKDEGGW
ncbi:MAG: hypothetical protein HWE34_04450 [Methylocystaceae bacterium]|nr:hypothetical protein [Methylocystaceae bacterium]